MATRAPQMTAAVRPRPRGAGPARRRSSRRPGRSSTSKGVREAQIEDIADAVGINRAIVYRHFSGKEELFALTLVELSRRAPRGPRFGRRRRMPRPQRLEALVGAFVDYGLAHPAFIDCAQALMRRSGPELLDEISESALFRLGRGISGCLAILAGRAPGRGRRRRRSGSRTRPCSPTPSTPAASAPSSSRGSASWCTRPAPGVPTVGEISARPGRAYLVAAPPWPLG